MEIDVENKTLHYKRLYIYPVYIYILYMCIYVLFINIYAVHIILHMMRSK